MEYKILIAFERTNRIYIKGTIQTFGEWTDEQKSEMIPNLINTGFIEEIAVTTPVETTETHVAE